jgi:hypothetical protein
MLLGHYIGPAPTSAQMGLNKVNKVDNDQQAWEILNPNFTDDKGIIRRKSSAYRPTALDFAAIDHLCDEWDYAWEGLL